MAAKPELLYLTPVVPALAGNGLAMRAGMVLEALSSRYSVSLIVVELYPSPNRDVSRYFGRICRRCIVVRSRAPKRWGLKRRPQPLSEVVRECKQFPFEVIHVFRVAMLRFSEPFLQAFPNARRHIDLDDIESTTHNRIAELAGSNGDHEFASQQREVADRSRLIEQQVCSLFDRIYVCSQSDRERFLELHSTTGVRILPNAVRMSELLRRPRGDVLSLLFPGTLGYYPNEDAALYLCGQIVPSLRKRATVPFEVRIVGSGATSRLHQAAAAAGADLPGFVQAIRSSYERATVVIVPLRAAGGTRIKILEAWSYGRPVVASSIGIEGLAAVHGKHALIADDPDSFADSCLRLTKDPELVDSLIRNGHSLVADHHSTEALRRTIDALDD
jgi:glycosyltransferase involved in cell wall biosynthesis